MSRPVGRPRARSSFGSIENRHLDAKGRPDRFRPKYRMDGDTRYQIGPTFQSVTAAQKWLDDEEYLIRTERWTPWSQRKAAQQAEKQRGKTLLLDHTHAWIHRTGPGNLAETTQTLYGSIYRTRLEPYLADVTLSDWTTDRARQWWKAIVVDHPTTAKRNKQAHDLLHASAGAAVSDGLLPINPVDVPEGRKKVESEEKAVPTQDQLQIIAQNVPKAYFNAVYISALCGLRIGEWRELRRKDILRSAIKDSELMTLHIARQAQRLEGETVIKLPKGEKTRKVLVPPNAVPLLEHQLKTYAQDGEDGLVFPNSRGNQTQPQKFRDVFKIAATTAGCPTVTPHSLRHYAGTFYAQTGATTKEIMVRLGHSTISAAMVYQHAAASREAELAARMASVMGALPIRMPANRPGAVMAGATTTSTATDTRGEGE